MDGNVDGQLMLTVDNLRAAIQRHIDEAKEGSTVTTKTPVWLLDVDGVINATRPGWGAPPRKGRARFFDDEFPIRWAPALVDRILALHRSGQIEIRWCTTWCPQAEQIEQLIGLPALPRAFTEDPGLRVRRAKHDAVLAVLAENRPLVWTDDDAIPESGRLFDELASAPAGALLIRPRGHCGLQPVHLDAIEAFIRLHQPAPVQP